MLTTVVRARPYFGVEARDTSQDINIEPLLMVASEAIENYCKRSFKKQEYTDRLDGSGTRHLIIKNYPIESVSELTVCEQVITDFEILKEKGMLFRRCGWSNRELIVDITYTAGYILPGDATDEWPQTLPKSLEIACIFYAKVLFDGRINVKSERVGDIAVTYTDESEKLPFTVISLIDPYVGRWV